MRTCSTVTGATIFNCESFCHKLASLTFGLPPSYISYTLTFLAVILLQVREATSNDPWGPSSSQMADLSDLTYNVVACNEIMTMLWKRLKDDKNWRHIHKVTITLTTSPLLCAQTVVQQPLHCHYCGCFVSLEISVYL